MGRHDRKEMMPTKRWIGFSTQTEEAVSTKAYGSQFTIRYYTCPRTVMPGTIV